LLKADFWRYKLHYSHFLNQNPTLFQPVGGMDAIAKAFEKRVRPFMRHNSVVEEIRKTPAGVRVVAGGEAIDADFAICTIPATVLRDIPNDFSPKTRAVIESIKFVPAVKIAFQARRRFWEEDQAIYGGISWTDQDITQIWYPPYGYHRDKGIIMGAYIWGEKPGLRFGGMAPAERLRAAAAEGERIHPGYASEIETGVSRSWLKTPFQKGGWPRSRHKSPEALQRPDGAIHFAGDQVSGLPGWQEGAVLGAHMAVNAINGRVLAE
ncbi:MAG: FAD-dependent oxidoreductase, partial [Deltaproteobacteria bacterium]|nr:FAD-dependent oxidoreductase [Deltaproteobacteria bacterium]